MNRLRARLTGFILGLSRRRIALWVVIAILGALTFWQWRVRTAHQVSAQQLGDVFREVDSGTRSHLTLSEAEALLSSSGNTGPISQSKQQMVVHLWKGPFRNYGIRLVLNDEGDVLSFDTETTIPEPVARAEVTDLTAHMTPDALKMQQRGQRFAAVDELIEKAEAPTLEGPGRKANARIRELLDNDLDDPFKPEVETVLQSEFVRRRTEWYRQQWLDNYHLHSRKDPRWTGLAETFLSRAVEAFGKTGVNRFDRHQFRPLVNELERAGCDDPLVKAVSLQFTYFGAAPMLTKPDGMVEAFFESDYPANSAWLAAYPALDAKDLLQLQAVKTVSGAEPFHNLLDIEDPIEMRIVFERLTAQSNITFQSNYAFNDHDFDRRTNLSLVLATQKPTPWLKFMLLACIRMTASDLESARACLRNAWYVQRQNPKAPTSMFHLQYHEYWNTREPGLLKEADLWFVLSTHAQFDYPPAWQTKLSWMYGRSNASTDGMMAHAQRCLETGRFDTDIPLEFLNVVRFLRTAANVENRLPFRLRCRQHFATEAIYAGFQKLVEGYAERPDVDVLQSYFACSAYLTGHFDEALTSLRESGMQLHPLAATHCQVTPLEIQQAAAMPMDRPFQPCPQQLIHQLEFVDGGKELLCVDDNDRVYRLNAVSGVVSGMPSPDDKIRLISANVDGTTLLAYDSEKRLTVRDLKSFEIVGVLPLPPNAASIFTCSGQKGYLSTSHRETEESGMTVTPFKLRDGMAEPEFATPFNRLSRVDLAIQPRLITAVGALQNPDTGREAAQILVWNLDSGEQLLKVQPFNSLIENIAISADGKLLAVSGLDWTNDLDYGRVYHRVASVKLVDVSSGEVSAILQHPGSVSRIMDIEEHGLLATGCADGIVRLWNPATGDLVTRLIGHERGVSSLAWLPEKDKLASADKEGRVRLWDFNNSPLQLQIALRSHALVGLSRLQIDPRTQDLLTESNEGALRWLSKSNYQKHDPVSSGPWQWTADGRGYVVGGRNVQSVGATPAESSAGEVKVMDLETGQLVKTVNVGSPRFAGAVISPDGKSLVTPGNMATVWNLQTGEPWPWGLLSGHKGPVVHVHFSRNGRRLTTTSRLPNPDVRVWELPEDSGAADARPRLLFEAQPRMSLNHSSGGTLTPDGTEFLLPNSDSYIQVWNVASKSQRGVIDGQSAQVSPDGTQVVVFDNASSLMVYDLATLKLQKSYPVHGGSPDFLQWGTDGDRLIYAVYGWVTVIDTATGNDLLRPEESSTDPE